MIKLFTVLLISSITLFTGAINIEENDEIPSINENVIIDADGQKYSSNTIIISVDPNASKTDLTDFFANNNLEIVYDYENFNMFTVKTQNNLTSDELDALISKLLKNKDILSVSKDYILELD